MMDRIEAFQAWAPSESPWSPWVKPILFADPQISITWEDVGLPEQPSLVWAPASADPPAALVVDIPGAQSVLAGLLLAKRGFRPVPLFNGAPGVDPLVPWAAVVKALIVGADELRELGERKEPTDYRGRAFAAGAPPVFLLDSNRLAGATVTRPGAFDNRWVVFKTDFPSGEFLRSHGIQRVIVRSARSTISEDLSHVLRVWAEAGLTLEVAAGDDDSPRELRVGKPSSVDRFLFRAMVFFRLRRNAAGAFGSTIPGRGSGLG